MTQHQDSSRESAAECYFLSIRRPINRTGSALQIRKLPMARTVNLDKLHLSEDNSWSAPTFVRAIRDLSTIR